MSESPLGATSPSSSYNIQLLHPLKISSSLGKGRATPEQAEFSSSDEEPYVLNRQAQIEADAEFCLQLQKTEQQQASAYAAIASGATSDVAPAASAANTSRTHSTPADWRLETIGTKAERKAARLPFHNAARTIQSSVRARLASLPAKEEARFQSELLQAIRESIGSSDSAGTSSSGAVISVASFTAAVLTAAATPRAATPPTSTAALAPTVASTASVTAAPTVTAVPTVSAAPTVTAAPTVAAVPTVTAASIVTAAPTITAARTITAVPTITTASAATKEPAAKQEPAAAVKKETQASCRRLPSPLFPPLVTTNSLLIGAY